MDAMMRECKLLKLFFRGIIKSRKQPHRKVALTAISCNNVDVTIFKPNFLCFHCYNLLMILLFKDHLANKNLTQIWGIYKISSKKGFLDSWICVRFIVQA